MSIKMGISCQRNGYWAATNHLSGCDLVQPKKSCHAVQLANDCPMFSASLVKFGPCIPENRPEKVPISKIGQKKCDKSAITQS